MKFEKKLIEAESSEKVTVYAYRGYKIRQELQAEPYDGRKSPFPVSLEYPDGSLISSATMTVETAIDAADGLCLGIPVVKLPPADRN